MNIEQLRKEFEGMAENFSTMFENTDDRELKEMYSTYNLYEIEPFFSQLKNQSQEGATFLKDESEYDPEHDDLYLYHIDFEHKRTLFKRLVLGPSLSYDTLFGYGAQGYKSATLYIRDNFKKPISLSYLTFNEGMPQVYTEVNESGVMTKTYKTEGNMLTGYFFDFFHFEPNEHDFKTEVFFQYDAEGELAKIIEVRNTGFTDVLYTKYEEGQTLDWALQKIEDYLVAQIHQQIVAKVSIEEEPVHTVLLEYCLQGPFPPTIGIGLASEQEQYRNEEPWMCYNAPDMLYFSERYEDEPGAIDIDLYDVEIQEAYRLVDRIYEEGEDLDGLQKRVYDTYLTVIKRLSDCDFSPSFTKTDSFMVMARDYDECNEEQFYRDMK
jgi:hypothetical protein